MTFGCGSRVDCGRPNRKPVTVIRSLTSYNNCRCPKSWEHDPPHDLSDDALHLLGEDEHHEDVGRELQANVPEGVLGGGYPGRGPGRR